MFLGRSKVYPVTNPNTPPTLYICPSKGPGKISQELMGPNHETSLIIYPNPSMNPSVTAIYPPSEQDGMLEILSSSGNLMFTKPIIAGSIKTDIEVDLAAGSYIVRRIVEDRIESAFWVLL